MLKLFTLSIVVLLSVPQGRGITPAVPDEFPSQDFSLQFQFQQGERARLAARQLADAPDRPETVGALALARDTAGILQALRRIVDTQPRRLAAALEAMGEAQWAFRGDDEGVRRQRDALQGIVADARQRLPELPREEAARAARVLLNLDAELSGVRDDSRAPLKRYVEEYRGTEAALLAEVDVIAADRATQAKFDALDAFAAAHPGTAAAAKAQYLKGFDWHTINTLGTLEPRGADPTNRFNRVMAVVEDLESGRYPESEWTRRAPQLISGFFIPRDATIAPDTIDRLVAAFTDFVRSHLALADAAPTGNGLGYVLTSKIPELIRKKGERVAVVERIFTDLERAAPDPSVIRYLRASFYMQRANGQSDSDYQAMRRKAKEELTALSRQGTGLYHRRALSSLATLQFLDREYEAARDALRRYEASYPRSPWTWVALLRKGQCEEALGNLPAAIAAYEETAVKYQDLPLAAVLAHEYSARALEASGEFDQSLRAHRRALTAWDDRYGVRYGASGGASPSDDPLRVSNTGPQVTKEALAARIAHLERALNVPGGADLERGRWLLERGRFDDASRVLKQILARFRGSPAAAEAAYLDHRVRLERALEAADAEAGRADLDASLQQLEVLAREPHDFAVAAAKIARASILWTRGDAGAEQTMLEALTGWHAHQRMSTPSGPLEEDVVAIRRAVFLPFGGPPYATSWNAFSWPVTPPPFFIVSSDVPVTGHDGRTLRVNLLQEFPATSRVLFADTEQLALLRRVLVKLGGTRTRTPGHIMDTPNQPVGDSMQILRLWQKFFPARPGHWGGWELESYPAIRDIQFTNPERTRAAVRVNIGYSGGTVELEKENGAWIAKRLTNQWVT